MIYDDQVENCDFFYKKNMFVNELLWLFTRSVEHLLWVFPIIYVFWPKRVKKDPTSPK